ncbi:hypothetical protein RhiirA5_386885, partial [Rhizophagus irregularis]
IMQGGDGRSDSFFHISGSLATIRGKRGEFSVSHVTSFAIGLEVGPKFFNSRGCSCSIKAKGEDCIAAVNALEDAARSVRGKCWESSREVPVSGAKGDALVSTGGGDEVKIVSCEAGGVKILSWSITGSEETRMHFSELSVEGCEVETVVEGEEP